MNRWLRYAFNAFCALWVIGGFAVAFGGPISAGIRQRDEHTALVRAACRSMTCPTNQICVWDRDALNTTCKLPRRPR